MSFQDLGLSSKVLASIEASGYVAPTPIQSQAIPHVLTRRDVVGIAQTGTGKTAGFVLPMLTLLEKGRARARMPRTLILEPTRELAAQVEEHFTRYGRNHKLTVALIIGGVSFDEQFKKLDRGVDVLIATPGRLLDHFERGKILMSGVEILVIDEADRMLDMGFIPAVERICKLLPFTRQTLFFSATMPAEIKRLADNFLSNPVRVEASPPATAATTVSLHMAHCGREPADKRAVLRALLRSATDFKNAIVFCNRKRDIATLHRSLTRHGFSAGALHGDMDQRSRTATLDDFRKGEIALLVASDVAARGLDIPAVSHIFNFDVPAYAEDFVHRIGRTGRAGLTGTAITIAAPLDKKYVAAIERLIGRPIPLIEVAADDERAKAFRKRGAPVKAGSQKPQAQAPTKPEAEAPEKPAAGVSTRPAAEAPTNPAEEDRTPERRSTRDAKRGREARSARDGKRDGKRREGKAEPPPERKRRDRRGGDKEPAVGLGDHVPAFLLRPVKIPGDS